MSAQHHGEKDDLRRRFLEQVTGTARREWSAGRMGGDDDGTLAYTMATDQKRGVIVMRFGKPVEWIGLGIKEAEELRDQLTERLMALRGATP
jgi:hypothetical protein